MPYFDRFDVCMAYAIFNQLYSESGTCKGYRGIREDIPSRLTKMQYCGKPWHKVKHLSANGFEIFANLVAINNFEPWQAELSDCDVSLEIEPDDQGEIDGCSDFPETIQWIKDQINDGNEHAWFTAKITVSLYGTDDQIISEPEYLSGCSYASKADFINDDGSGYYSDMVSMCLKDLNNKLFDMQTLKTKKASV